MCEWLTRPPIPARTLIPFSLKILGLGIPDRTRAEPSNPFDNTNILTDHLGYDQDAFFKQLYLVMDTRNARAKMKSVEIKQNPNMSK